MRPRYKGLDRRDSTRPAEPLEREIARMKQQRTPVIGGATPVYGDEDGEVFIEGDYRVGKLDIGRHEVSRVVAQRELETADLAMKEENQDAEAKQE